MSPEQLFSAVNLLALVGWVLIALLPRRRQVVDVIASLVIPAVLATLYIALIASAWGSTPGGFSTLQGVAALFSNPWLLLAGWIHYLAFDLLIGCWEVREAQARAIPHWMVLPCLLLTFLFGPAGWLLFTIIRASARGATTVQA